MGFLLPATGKPFDPETDIPDLAGKVILVTGANTGIGKATVVALAVHQPERIYLAARDAEKAAGAIKDVEAAVPGACISFLELDLASLASVRSAARRVISEVKRLDILVCNAGIMAAPPGLTVDGYELQFQTNHLGHALLIKLLLPTLLHTAEAPDSDVRVICQSSLGFQIAPMGGIRFDSLKTTQEDLSVLPDSFGTYYRYGQSKLANILTAAELAKRYPQITAVSVHPGIVDTQLLPNYLRNKWIRLVMTRSTSLKTPMEGAYNQLWTATAPKDHLVNGEFYEAVGVLGVDSCYSKSEKLAAQLWDWTMKELEAYETDM
ncbi:hypothetical protein W97_00073 [Coniosporium apollinis CBS 100218]|uniref:Oxidoreductase n=1 Tax=Coniosporium apollinis (strain CBS 100218) TaxID=1168221 RepID=R7YG48_CONA1|nr:uncharacterized protein W97_00073 [Coniosporium apollinis CBS 100218]EON60863.1 hypothetical protein W97_00073 [Coniosporium apollinis CBS 100218]